MRHTCHILDSHYEKSNLHKVASESKKLTEEERIKLHTLLTKYEFLFNQTLGTCKNKPVDIELQPHAKPHNVKLYPLPRAHKAVFNK